MFGRASRMCRGVLLFGVIAATASGCAIGLGGGHDEYTHQGAMSEEEYLKQKEKILRSAGM
jgi:hypothetical protein